MTNNTDATGQANWFVGASFGGVDSQTERFMKDGIWENGYVDRYLDEVKSVRVGDRIALKSSYTRKNNLPFDNGGQSVSVMAIIAVGTVTENPGDGRRLRVRWTEQQERSSREWYFFTYRSTIHRVLPGGWKRDALIAFTFNGTSQDLDTFRNAPNWRERFGTTTTDDHRFQWTRFYEAMADKLCAFRHDRNELVAAIHAIGGRLDAVSILQDKFADGTVGPMKDICPFTAMGVFNRGITIANRRAIAGELAKFLGVKEPVPKTFEGIPVVNNQRSWFYAYEKKRKSDDIDALWEVFEKALASAAADDSEARDDFAKAFDDAASRWGVSWNLTFGLYWIRPWAFAPLDSPSRVYLEKKLAIEIGRNGNKQPPNGADYLDLLAALENRFDDEDSPVHSYPEFSLAAWRFKDSDAKPDLSDSVKNGGESEDSSEGKVEEVGPKPTPTIVPPPYSIDTIINDGCFLERSELDKLLERLRTKKNLILQGPPGTGKTWLAKRLGFALMGQHDEVRMKVLQFHPNMSYEDFVRGWRPTGEGRLALVDGPLMEMITAARKSPEARHVVVIEEINRGNPAQIFGEMLTLMEADKRNPREAIELCHRRTDGERVFIPDNVFIIGTMNLADRSLALVDYALRRRFAFVDMAPKLGALWRAWVANHCGVDVGFLDEVERRIRALNEEIAADASLGKSFRIGHSFVTPPLGVEILDACDWFIQVVNTEIGPLLEEYWFDALDKANAARARLVEGL